MTAVVDLYTQKNIGQSFMPEEACSAVDRVGVDLLLINVLTNHSLGLSSCQRLAVLRFYLILSAATNKDTRPEIIKIINGELHQVHLAKLLTELKRDMAV